MPWGDVVPVTPGVRRVWDVPRAGPHGGRLGGAAGCCVYVCVCVCAAGSGGFPACCGSAGRGSRGLGFLSLRSPHAQAHCESLVITSGPSLLLSRGGIPAPLLFLVASCF